MRTMSSRARLLASGSVAVALAAVLAGCGGATVDGEAPEVSTEGSTMSTSSSTPFAEERPEKPTEPVPPPPVQSPAPEPLPGEPAPLPAPEPETGPAPAPDLDVPQPPPAAPGDGDFLALMESSGVVLPEGMDPVATAHEACGRFDGGQQMDEVSGWLGEAGRLDPDGQGYFLGAAVTTYCPGNIAKLG